MWKPIRQKLIERSSQSSITQKDLEKRYDLSEQLYPLPQEKGQSQQSADSAYRVNLSEKEKPNFDVEQLKRLAGFW